ncbi:MAG: MBL fold metallo-hydrolase [Victivallaceae bacterium]|nr:MBL fold metallo-hydrolase [Victivallaceae bacterium]
MKKSTWRKIFKISILTLLSVILLLLIGIIGLFSVAYPQFGKLPDSAEYERYAKLSNFKDGKFVNEEPMRRIVWKNSRRNAISRFVFESPKSPDFEIPRHQLSARSFAGNPADLKVYWLGHSFLIMEIDGTRIITDPVFGNAGPLKFIVRRFQPPPLRREDLPEADAIIISHDHYDHLEFKTIMSLREKSVRFIVPLGAGAHLQIWGIAPERITELNWGEHTVVGNLKVTAQTARHFSGRRLDTRNLTLWASFVLEGPRHKVFFGGDGGYGKHFKSIGEKFGPFDLTCLEIGSWNERWPDSHLFPEQTIQAHRDLRGKYLLPIHWAAFDLAFHDWDEPIKRAVATAVSENVKMLTPIQGDPLIPGETPVGRWWLKQDAPQNLNLSKITGEMKDE